MLLIFPYWLFHVSLYGPLDQIQSGWAPQSLALASWLGNTNDPPPAQRTKRRCCIALVIAFAGERWPHLSFISLFQKAPIFAHANANREEGLTENKKWVFVGRGPKWTKKTSHQRRRTTTTTIIEEEEGESSEDAYLLERSKPTTFLTLIQLFKLLIALLVLASASFHSFLFCFVLN